jgi:hypothetical protein
MAINYTDQDFENAHLSSLDNPSYMPRIYGIGTVPSWFTPEMRKMMNRNRIDIPVANAPDFASMRIEIENTVMKAASISVKRREIDVTAYAAELAQSMLAKDLTPESIKGMQEEMVINYDNAHFRAAVNNAVPTTLSGNTDFLLIAQTILARRRASKLRSRAWVVYFDSVLYEQLSTTPVDPSDPKVMQLDVIETALNKNNITVYEAADGMLDSAYTPDGTTFPDAGINGRILMSCPSKVIEASGAYPSVFNFGTDGRKMRIYHNLFCTIGTIIAESVDLALQRIDITGTITLASPMSFNSVAASFNKEGDFDLAAYLNATKATVSESVSGAMAEFSKSLTAALAGLMAVSQSNKEAESAQKELLKVGDELDGALDGNKEKNKHR